MGSRSHALACGLLVLVTGWGAPTAEGGEGELSARRAEEWGRARVWILGRTVDATSLRTLESMLPSFDAEALDALASTSAVHQLPDEQRVPMQHALRALAYLRRLGAHLDRGPAICLLLGRAEDEAWARALVELLREPFGERLGVVAERLSRDRRGPMRRMAGTLALYLGAFCRGSGSEWRFGREEGWDPTPLARDVAARLLADRNPAVACRFASYDAYSFEDKAIVDLMVAHLGDEREAPKVDFGLLSGHERTVGEACRASLSAQFVFYRRPDSTERVPAARREAPVARRRVESLPADESPDALSRWWSEVRQAWSFTPDGSAWERVADVVLTVPKGGTRRIDTPWGELDLTVAMYDETIDDDEPRLSIRVEVGDASERGLTMNLGNPTHHPGYGAGGASAGCRSTRPAR
jgi:hypothetical protein